MAPTWKKLVFDSDVIRAHSDLSELDYASAGHTGFAGTGVANTFSEEQTFDENLVMASGKYIGLDSDGDGRIELNAHDTPRISLLKQGDAQTEVVRIGDLNGLGAYAAETWGAVFGEIGAGSAAVAIDATNGIRIIGDNVVLGQWDVSGGLTLGELATDKANVYWNPSNDRLEFRGGTAGTVVQSYIDTDGAFVAGGGSVTLNTDGFNLKFKSGYYTENAISFWSDENATYDVRQDSGSATGYAERFRVSAQDGIAGVGDMRIEALLFEYDNGGWTRGSGNLLLTAPSLTVGETGAFISLRTSANGLNPSIVLQPGSEDKAIEIANGNLLLDSGYWVGMGSASPRLSFEAGKTKVEDSTLYAERLAVGTLATGAPSTDGDIGCERYARIEGGRAYLGTTAYDYLYEDSSAEGVHWDNQYGDSLLASRFYKRAEGAKEVVDSTNTNLFYVRIHSDNCRGVIQLDVLCGDSSGAGHNCRYTRWAIPFHFWFDNGTIRGMYIATPSKITDVDGGTELAYYTLSSPTLSSWRSTTPGDAQDFYIAINVVLSNANASVKPHVYWQATVLNYSGHFSITEL